MSPEQSTYTAEALQITEAKLLAIIAETIEAARRQSPISAPHTRLLGQISRQL